MLMALLELYITYKERTRNKVDGSYTTVRIVKSVSNSVWETTVLYYPFCIEMSFILG